MKPGQILKAARPTKREGGPTLDSLARAINERCPGRTFDRIDLWKMENDQRSIPGDVLIVWLDLLGVPNTKRWETIAAQLGLTVPGLLSALGLPVTEGPASEQVA